ncbi:MAG: 4'-phosphopantetheinyl transferase superfamily protein [Bacteroidales bacterium]|nr:4'-phosphopantetheinyl transferase superfamily protein [Bacteroidales bacterium]
MIDIFFTFFENPLEQNLFSDYLSVLSPELKEKNSRYIRWQNRHSHLFGKLLLIEALKRHGIENDIWNYVEYNSYDRPYLTLNEYDFNITHSGNYVACAIGKNIRLGIDIEENRDVNLKHFDTVMTPSQWNKIYNANYPLKEFFKYWTIKESVIKADGRGFAIPLDKLEVKNNTVQYDDKSWLVQELKIGSNYSAALATNQLTEFKIHEINYYHNDTNRHVIPQLERQF